MRALITGGAGFIGAHLAKALCRRGASVDLVDDFSRGRHDGDLRDLLARPEVDCVERDLRAPDALGGLDRDYDQIFHLAAIVGVANVETRPFAVLRDNPKLLINVLDLARRQPRLQRLVFASTSEVHAGSLRHLDLQLPTPEPAPIALPDLGEPRSTYLMSKLYGEALCHHAGVPYTIVRPHNVYGPRMGLAHVIPELLQRAVATADGGVLSVYSPTHTRAFCYVDDAVEMIALLALAPDAEGQVFNIGNQSEEIAMRDLAARIVALLGKRLRVADGSDTRGSPARRCPDMTRTIGVTDYVPRVALDAGLQRTYAWYRDRRLANAEAGGR
jgi:nucleoside-diphosphate-sugar epimerase